MFNPDPRVLRKPDPEGPGVRDACQVVDECLDAVGIGDDRVERGQPGAKRVAVRLRLEPGGFARRRGLRHAA